MKNINFYVSIIGLIALSILGWFFFSPTDKTENVIPEDATASTYTIVAFGDSLTAGYGLPLFESYPYQLEEKLKAKGLPIKVINAGVSGETTKGNNERASFIRDQNPDMVILGIGGNDALRALPVKEVKENIESTINLLKSAGSKPQILLLQMQSPLNVGFAYKSQFDAVYKDLSKKYNLPLVPFLTVDVFSNPELMLPDRIHPNKAGYAKLIDENIFDVVLKYQKSK